MAANQNHKLEKPDNGEPKFEASLEELEEIVSQLEAGDKPLDESLALYEKGVAALKRCHIVLDKAEKRIRLLVKGAAGEPALQEAEVPVRPSASNRARAQKPAPPQADEDAAQDVQESKNSEQQSVDSEAQPRNNVPPSVTTKPRTNGGPDAGGSLFGSSK